MLLVGDAKLDLRQQRMNVYLVAGSAAYVIVEAAANIFYFDYENEPARGSWGWYIFQYGRFARAVAGVLILVGAFLL
jgi:hypothetical protein